MCTHSYVYIFLYIDHVVCYIFKNKECSLSLIEHIYVSEDSVDRVRGALWLSVSRQCDHQTKSKTNSHQAALTESVQS